MTIEAGVRLFQTNDADTWARALESYPSVIEAQDVSDLTALDTWYRETLPQLLQQRSPLIMEPGELEQVVKWKMRRGEWRARNLALVRGNPPELVRTYSLAAFNPATPPRKALAALSELGGVGPATASAALAAARPLELPFLDDLVGAAIPALGKPSFTVSYYLKYADALIAKAASLGSAWTAQSVGFALWSAIGGKKAIANGR